jgi:hypothetical protein
LCRGYIKGKYEWSESEADTDEALWSVFRAREDDICWVTPVCDEHFTYHASMLIKEPGRLG